MRNCILTLCGLFLLTMGAKADSYTFTIDHCSSACGANLGTVTVTQDGTNTVKIDVESQGTGFEFANSAGGGYEFFFNIQAVAGGNANNPNVTFSNMTSGWSPSSESAGSFGGAGWSFEYGLTCLSGKVCEHGASDPKAAPLIFDVTAPGLSPTSFMDSNGTTDNGHPVLFAADVIGIKSGNTGLIGATLTSTGNSTTPEPTAVLLLFTVCACLIVPVKRFVQRSQA